MVVWGNFIFFSSFCESRGGGPGSQDLKVLWNAHQRITDRLEEAQPKPRCFGVEGLKIDRAAGVTALGEVAQSSVEHCRGGFLPAEPGADVGAGDCGGLR